MNDLSNEVNNSVVSTPMPQACSTQTKKGYTDKKLDKPVPRMLTFQSQTDDSLGILAMDEMGEISSEAESDVYRRMQSNTQFSMSYQPTFSIPSSKDKDINEQLRLYRERANATLHRISNTSLPHMPNHSIKVDSPNPSWTESTVNETDLLRTRHHTNKTSHEISLLSEQFRNTDISLKDILSQFSNKDYSSIHSDMFMQDDEAANQLRADEMSWRKHNEMPPSTSQLSAMDVTTDGGKLSYGEFFIGQSNDPSSIFQQPSPVKTNPVALMNSTTIDEESTRQNSPSTTNNDRSLLSISQIRQLITSESDTPNKFINKLQTKRTTLTQINSPLYTQQKFSSAIDLTSEKDDDDVVNAAKMIAASSMSCISDASNKENVGVMERSLSSVRSTSSMGTIPDGKLPIECTKQEIVWGCIKLGKSSSQEFVVRNRYQKKLRFQISSTNPSFRITKIDSEPQQIVNVLLHPMESKQISVMFMPTNVGVQVGTLNFHPIVKQQIQHNQKQKLMLYGYGGYTIIELQNIAKDSNGKLWLSFGNFDNKTEFVKEFTVRNNGVIAGFVSFISITAGLCAFVQIEITPSDLTLKPGESSTIRIRYIPTKKDYKHILTTFNTGVEVYEVSQIRMISGAEIIRQRIKRLTSRLNKEQLQVEPVMQHISKRFTGELNNDELKQYKESISATNELMHLLNYRDILLTLEQDVNSTLVGGLDGDESSVFKTLVNHNDNSALDVTISNNKALSIEPTKILLTPYKLADSILITSECDRPVTFRVRSEPEGVLEVSKRSDIVDGGKMRIINVGCIKEALNRDSTQNIKVFISTDERVYEVDVKILHSLHS